MFRTLILTLTTACCLVASPAAAALVTTQEAGLDAIFSQASFGADSIDIRFFPTLTIIDPDLITIDSDADFNKLSTWAPDPFTNVNLFYVDAINFCGSPGANIIGCGSTPGFLVALDSGFAAHPIDGPELIAHEIGHNLGLQHTSGAGLMGPVLNHETTLSEDEVMTIFDSPLVKLDAEGYFINVTPVLVRATAVPEPGSFAICGLVAGAIVARRRRRTA
ncbi:matrixin family metalloprotease [Novipirellula artificiosorum]|uniref:matrixin family metalloprotease n=1 Tax=Novipirellula artificiosorum TaxID=2528016 RepID=UPI0018CD4549|nr:matrixin family metalloprotease [Novipirellula artificiosorum]